MKKSFLILLLLTFSNVLFAQEGISKDSSYWKQQGFLGLNFSQTALSNWQGGGQDNVAFTGILNVSENYKRGGQEWKNNLDMQYGVFKQNGSGVFQKNIDQILAVTQYNIYAFKKYWFYSIMADFRSQFKPGYIYSGDSTRTKVSDFLAPAYIQLALGLTYQPADYFSATISPIAGKITIVNDQRFANNGDYGVTKAVRDPLGNIITPGKMVRAEFGGRVTIKFKKDIFKNVNLDTYADFFSNYLHNPQNIDIVWNTLLAFKINKFFTATITTKMIYDDDIIISYDWNKDGKYDNKNDIHGPRTQWLTNIGIGFGYKF